MYMNFHFIGTLSAGGLVYSHQEVRGDSGSLVEKAVGELQQWSNTAGFSFINRISLTSKFI